MRLIDAEKLWLTTEYTEDGKVHKYYEQFEVDEAPTIDAEPVVRCKDCHYAKPYNKIWQLPKRDTLVCTHFANDEVDNNFFCGYAIKKMDEVNEGNDNNET